MYRFTFLLLSVLLVTATVSAADLSGVWTGRQVAAGDGFPNGRTGAVQLTVAQKGPALDGVFTVAESKPVKIEAGRIGESGKITFWLRDAQNFLVTAQLTLDGEWLRGRLTSSTGRVMNVALRRE